MSDPKAMPVVMGPEPNPSPKPEPKPRREFRHPVLQVMGIRRLRLPTRNWTIFWTITGSFLGAYFYDRHARKQVREDWKAAVRPLAEQPMATDALPRKVTVYIAPPPNDYLDAAMAHFRQYVKPILTAGAVDHELVVEEGHQGHIRTVIAEKIRDQRRKNLGLPTVLPEPVRDELDKKIDHGLTRDMTGGVIIIGRGAYKEYMAGLHEGYLGPLDKPARVVEHEAAEAKRLAESDFDETKDPESEEEYNEKRKREMARKYPVTETFLTTSEYAEAPSAPELETASFDPISVVRHPHLLGFLSTPWRVYRWLNQRYLADELCGQAAGVVYNLRRPYELPQDTELAESDEEDWPRRFKSQGRDKNSEWMRDLVVDPRIAERLQVYIPADRDHLPSSEPSEPTVE